MSRSNIVWSCIGLLLLAGGIFVWRIFSAPVGDPQPAGNGLPPVANAVLDRPTSLRLIELRHLGLGQLENHAFPKATATFDEILTLLPVEPFALRNRAISQVKHATEKIDERAAPEEFASAMDAARKAVQKLAAAAAEAALPEFLESVLAAKTSEPTEIVVHLREALKRDPNHAAWWFQWFELGRSFRLPADKDEAFSAGERAAELAPDNMFVQKEVVAELLVRQVDLAKDNLEEANRQADAIVARLEALRQPLRVLGVSIQVQAKADVVRILDAVLTAVRSHDWQRARNEFFKIKNLLSQETASDADLMHSHPLTYHDPLNYVATDYSETFYQRADLPVEMLPKIEVTFRQSEGVLPDVDADVFALNWLDVDLDGRSELVTQSPSKLTIFRRTADGSWDSTLLDVPGQYLGGFLAADLDDDVVDLTAERPGQLGPVNKERCHEADPDFILYGTDGVLLVRNTEDQDSKTRRLKAIESDQSGFAAAGDVIHAQLVDFDHDGDLDLATVELRNDGKGRLRLWINLGNFTFREATDRSIGPPPEFDVAAIAAVDWDQDNDVDLLLSGPTGGGWMENLRHGRMRFRTDGEFWSGAFQILVTELDGADNWDLVLTDDDGIRVVTTSQPIRGLPVIKQDLRLPNTKEVLPRVFDFDNDGAADLLTSDLRTLSLWRNDGAGKFAGAGDSFLAGISASDLVAHWADVDSDGDLDLLHSDGGALQLLTNDGGNANKWLNVQIRAQQVKANEQGASKRVNHYGIGSTIEVKNGTRYQAQLVDSPTTHFGIGPAEKADIVRTIMTNGVPQNRIEPAANTLICERQILLTSCPYLYAWNGERYEFVTDLVWASPLGLKASQTELVPWRDWEYLKIDGSKLKAVDGEYRLQLTEELWEVAYFDQVRFFAVDHSADVEIFTNEKVGSPDLAAHKIHTARKSVPPRFGFSAAVDQTGADWKSALELRDENYTRTWARQLAQGLCEEHYLELTLDPNAEPRKTIRLFLTGWVRPTDTNINVALDQNPDLPLPAGLALWTPDEAGNWREVSPHVGFPNGKTKTIVIDLSQAFSAGDYRLRLVSNREFYWDHAFFIVDDDPVEVREYELSLRTADLHHRGVSRGILPPGDGPETYVYDQLAAIPAWPTIDGYFTRYGDVLPLLKQRDDQLVVMGIGDEISLTFDVPAEPLPDGWQRDFVISNVGWVKDCLLNTWEGQRVDPLPFAEMQGHDYWTGRPELVGEYAAYLRNYQTRRQPETFRPYVRRFTSETKKTLPAWERDRRHGD